jgi:hypothetical protein
MCGTQTQSHPRSSIFTALRGPYARDRAAVRRLNHTLFSAWEAKAMGRKAFEVVLSSGDALYIPPYWFHYVTVVGGKVRAASHIFPSDTRNMYGGYLTGRVTACLAHIYVPVRHAICNAKRPAHTVCISQGWVQGECSISASVHTESESARIRQKVRQSL